MEPFYATAACQQVHCIGYLEAFQNGNQTMVARKRETDRERGREVGNYYKKSKNNDLITNLKPFWGRYWSRLYFLLQLRRVLITGATQVRPVMGGMIL